MRGEPISARLPESVVGEIEAIAGAEKTDRSIAMRKLLEMGIQGWKKKEALASYREGKVTLWKAAEIAGVSLREMMDLIKEAKVPYQHDTDALGEYVERILKGL
ncbi:unnamed protein product [marine sediment metagenome]|uniref:Ribbon-helix-helix protein CopG domain-containing protein n=1 Tax=marine sediment metagenome TaxID=412755 RepID=X1N9D7_9ZZZZ